MRTPSDSRVVLAAFSKSASSEIRARARTFRKAPTLAEDVLWEGLRRRSLLGLKFRRQHVILGYVVDFYCPDLMLAIEVDGAIHDERVERDAIRTQRLNQVGVRVVRVTNDAVLWDLEEVLREIGRVCARLGGAP